MSLARYPIFAVSILITCSVGCSHAVRQAGATWQDDAIADSVVEEDVLKEIQIEDLSITSENPGQNDRRANRIPIEINDRVVRWIKYFAVKDRTRFARFIKRGLEYKPLIQGILKESGVPQDLYYLAMIESGFVLHARSRARAVGAWQFIRGTAKKYGLKKTAYIDERRDVIRSTQAAAKYLKRLHDIFGNWYLAMAAYNAGEGRILRAIARGKSSDFWELLDKKAMPPETRNYVPKFLAAAIICRNLERYHFETPSVRPLPLLVEVRLPGSVRLSDVSKRLALPSDLVKKINAHLIRGVTPPSSKGYPVWIPSTHEKKLRAVASALPIHKARRIASRSRKVASHSRKKKHTRYHKVRSGDALARISRRYGVSVRRIKKVNSLRSNRIYVGQVLKVQPKL